MSRRWEKNGLCSGDWERAVGGDGYMIGGANTQTDKPPPQNKKHPVVAEPDLSCETGRAFRRRVIKQDFAAKNEPMKNISGIT